MCDWALAIVGFASGLLTSLVVVWYWEQATKPKLKLAEHPSPDLGQAPDQPPHAFYHLVVSHTRPWPPFASRRPAWSCRATIEVFDAAGTTRAIRDIIDARWPSQPEPVKTMLRDGRPEQLFDPTLIFVGRKADIHFQDSRNGRVQVDLAVKFEGDEVCAIFSNESYFHPQWMKPEWILEPRGYRVRVTVYYETGSAKADFSLENKTTSRTGLVIRKVS